MDSLAKYFSSCFSKSLTKNERMFVFVCFIERLQCVVVVVANKKIQDLLGLQKLALSLFRRLRGLQRGQDRLIENVLEPFLRQRRALDVFDRLQFLGQLLALLQRDGLLLVLGQLLQRALLVTQIDLRADEQEGRLLTVMRYLRHPLFFDVLERTGTDHGETYQEYVRLWVRQWPQPIVILLTGSIKQAQCVGFAADHDRDGVVVEDGWHVLRGEFVGRVGDEQAGLTDGTVAHHDALYRLHLFSFA